MAGTLHDLLIKTVKNARRDSLEGQRPTPAAALTDTGPGTEPAAPLLDLPGEVSAEIQERVTQALIRIIVRQVRAELERSEDQS